MNVQDWQDLADDDGKYAIALALLEVAKALDRLGNGNAITQMGAIEALGVTVKDGLASVANALHVLADRS